jgi:hypothetical protein
MTTMRRLNRTEDSCFLGVSLYEEEDEEEDEDLPDPEEEEDPDDGRPTSRLYTDTEMMSWIS